MIMKSKQEEDMTFLNIYAPNIGEFNKANINRHKGRK